MTTPLARLLLLGTATIAFAACQPSASTTDNAAPAATSTDINVPARFKLVERYTGEGEDVADNMSALMCFIQKWAKQPARESTLLAFTFCLRLSVC